MGIAICISGDSFNYKEGYNWLKENYLDKYNCDVYIHTWDNLNNIEEIIKLYTPKSFYTQPPIPFDYNNLELNQILNNLYSTHSSYNLIRESNNDYDHIIHIKFGEIIYNNTPEKFAICSPTISEHYADVFTYALYYTFMDEEYKNWENKEINETLSLIKYHLHTKNLSLDILKTSIE